MKKKIFCLSRELRAHVQRLRVELELVWNLWILNDILYLFLSSFKRQNQVEAEVPAPTDVLLQVQGLLPGDHSGIIFAIIMMPFHQWPTFHIFLSRVGHYRLDMIKHRESESIFHPNSEVNAISNQMNTYSSKLVGQNGMKAINCNQCDFTSLHMGHLKRHLKTHSEEKPYQCNQCDSASVHANNLRRHVKMHSGGKAVPM